MEVRGASAAAARGWWGGGLPPAVPRRGGTVELWALPSGAVPATLHRAALGAEASASWQAAVLALPRSLPVLWRDLRELAQREPAVRVQAGT